MLTLHGEQLATATQQLDHPHDRFLPEELDKEVIAEAKRVKEKYTDDLRKAKAEAAARVRTLVCSPQAGAVVVGRG